MWKKVLESKISSKNQGSNKCIPCQKKNNFKRGYDSVFLTEIRQFLAKVSALYSNICAPPPIWCTRKRYNHPSTEEWHRSHYLLQLLLLNLGCGIKRKKRKHFLTIWGGWRGWEREGEHIMYYSSCLLTMQNFDVLAVLSLFDLKVRFWAFFCVCVWCFVLGFLQGGGSQQQRCLVGLAVCFGFF